MALFRHDIGYQFRGSRNAPCIIAPLGAHVCSKTLNKPFFVSLHIFGLAIKKLILR